MMKKNTGKILSEYFLYFMMYSILGWIYEVFLEVVVYRWGFSNRGVLFGPYCTVYGGASGKLYHGIHSWGMAVGLYKILL